MNVKNVIFRAGFATLVGIAILLLFAYATNSQPEWGAAFGVGVIPGFIVGIEYGRTHPRRRS